MSMHNAAISIQSGAISKCTATVAEGGSAKADFLEEGTISGLLEIRPGLIRPGRI